MNVYFNYNLSVQLYINVFVVSLFCMISCSVCVSIFMVHLAVKKLFRRPGLSDLSCDSVLSNSSLTIPLNLQSAIFPLAHSVLFHFL